MIGVSVVTSMNYNENIILLPGHGVVPIDVHTEVETLLFAKQIVRLDSL